MSSTFGTHRRAAVIASIATLGLTACGGDTGPRAPGIRSVRIDPTVQVMSVGASVPLRAIVDADPGADTTVRWTSDPSESGAVSPVGRLTACYPPGTIVVHATSVADPTKSATLTAQVVIPSVGWAFVGGVVHDGDAGGVPNDTVSAEAEILIVVSPAIVLVCRGVERVDVRLEGGGIDSLISRFDFAPPFSDSHVLRVPLRADALPNGVYQITGTVYVSGVKQTVSLNGRAITVRHP